MVRGDFNSTGKITRSRRTDWSRYAMLSSATTRSRPRQAAEFAFGMLGCLIVAAVLVAIFRQDPEERRVAADVTTQTPIVRTERTATGGTATPSTSTETVITIPSPSVTPSPTAQPTETMISSTDPAPAPDSTAYGVLTSWDAKVYQPGALTVGPDDRVYVLDLERGQVAIFTRDLGQVGSIDLTAGASLADGYYDLAVDGNSTIHLLDGVAGRVVSYSAEGIITASWDGASEVSSEASAGALVQPLAIAVDETGIIYVTEELPDGRGRVRSFTPNGTEVTVWWTINDEPLPDGLQAIAVEGETVSILADSIARRGAILQLDANSGAFIRQVEAFGDDALDTVRRSLAVDSSGTLFVSDPGTGGVDAINPTTGPVFHWTPDDIESVEERTPNPMVGVDSQGHVYVFQPDRVLMTVLAPPEVIEAARTPIFNVSPGRATCGDEVMAYGAQFRVGDRVTILAAVAGTDDFVLVGEATVDDRDGYPGFTTPLSLAPLGVCDMEIDLDGIEITVVAQADGDPKSVDPTTLTLYSSTNLPTLKLTPVSGDCESLITATGTHFVPGTTVTIMLAGHQPAPLAVGVAVEKDGTFETTFSLSTCMDGSDMMIVARTDWSGKQEGYPFAQTSFVVARGD